ncbi:hypothetical protein R70199_07940 [Paraburkholderia domus]|jgi:hypothetical protein|nr:hypothetical protein R70199_07940 [Paraburkholderia domus]
MPLTCGAQCVGKDDFRDVPSRQALWLPVLMGGILAEVDFKAQRRWRRKT